MSLSVVVCTHNPRPALIERAVQAVISQLDAVPGSELIIVDNASVVPVASLPIFESGRVRVVIEPVLGLTAARARAAATARGDIIVFVDDDNILAPDYVLQAAALFSNPQVGVLSGRVEPEYEDDPPSWIGRHEGALAIRRHLDDSLKLVKGYRYTSAFPIGAGMVVRRDLLQAYFRSASLTGHIEGRRGSELLAGEDTDLALFAISEGWLVGCCGRLRLQHVIPASRTTVDYIIRLNRGALKSAALVNAKWRARFGGDIFDFIREPRWRVQTRAAIYSLLSFLPAFRVRAAGQRDLLQMRG